MRNPIEKTIADATRAFEVGVHPNFIKWALLIDGYSDKRADLIMLWARQAVKKEIEPEIIISDPTDGVY